MYAMRTLRMICLALMVIVYCQLNVYTPFSYCYGANFFSFFFFFFFFYSTTIASNLLVVDEIMKAGMSSLKSE